MNTLFKRIRLKRILLRFDLTAVMFDCCSTARDAREPNGEAAAVSEASGLRRLLAQLQHHAPQPGDRLCSGNVKTEHHVRPQSQLDFAMYSRTSHIRPRHNRLLS